MKWILTSEALPEDGQAVCFLIEHHATFINGTYHGGTFESNWATHDAGRVQSWCPAAQAESVDSEQQPLA